MSFPAVQTTTTATFVVRFWRETTVGEVRWRGQIEHVQSGEHVSFLEIDAMLRFLRRFGILIDDHERIVNPPSRHR